jgi:hypothetical protein
MQAIGEALGPAFMVTLAPRHPADLASWQWCIRPVP